MPPTGQITLPEYHHPQTNLFRSRECRSPEAELVDGFVEAYLRDASIIHQGTAKTDVLLAREVPVNSLGIADVVTLAWDPAAALEMGCDETAEGLEALAPTIRAFEAKMTHWRKGLAQAHRYRYYADASILVVPFDVLSVAQKALDTFRKLSVGLWGFDLDTSRIRPAYTPRPRHTSAPRYRRLALTRMAEAIRSRRDV